VRALARLRGKLGVKCLLVGEGDLADALRDAVDALRLQDVCSIVPFQKDIAPVMNAMDILILPSRQESFGLVVIEAAMWNVPTIACRSQGPSETIVTGETGLLIEQDDECGLAEAIRMSFTGNRYKAWGIAAERRARACFDPATNTRLLEHVLINVIKKSGSEMHSN
jgi:glycosyltransferase involved in cell wall biosynthesis